MIYNMSIEAPVQIDISDDNSWDQIDDTHLTEEDKDFLREQFREEQERIIYLTRQELSELSRIVETQRNSWISPSVRDAMSWELDEFIESQIGLSLSDVLGEDSEEFQIVENLAEEFLFGEDWAMTALNLSQRPQQYLTTSLSLSIIEQIQSLENPRSALENLDQTFVEMWAWLELLHELTNLREDLPNWQTHPRISLSENGEQNIICMDISEGKNFFNELLSWELDQESIRDRLHSANHNEEIESADISEIINETQSIIEAMRSSPSDIVWDNDDRVRSVTDEDIEGALDDTIDWENKNLMDRFRELIEAILDALKSMFEGVGDWSQDTWTSVESPEDTREAWDILPDDFLSEIDELSSIQLGWIDTASLRASLENQESQILLREILEWLIPEKNLAETIEHLFSGENTIFWQFSTALRNSDFPALTDNTANTTPLSQFQAILEEYQNYRASEGVSWETEWRTTWQEYAHKRKEEDWAS